jgi:phosphoglycerol transferase MdoB-like AlkP superfamily enzyme
LAFGIIEDETSSVLKSIWTDYPVIRILLFASVLFYILHLAISKIYKSGMLMRLSKYRKSKYAAFVIIIACIFLIRGRLGLFPLKIEDAYFSKNQFVNILAQNGIFTLKNAVSDYLKSDLDVSIDKMLADAGFSSDKELIASYLNIPVDSIIHDPLLYLQNKSKADSFLLENPPHVVFIQMEGMGSNYMDWHSGNFNILAQLANEMQNCIVFRNFLPFSETTISTLEGILTNNVMPSISTTIYRDKTNIASAVTPFNKAGYVSSFITGAKKSWRNLDVYIPAQGFENYESKEIILQDIPEAQQQEWGVYDAYTFRQAINRLDTATSPQFIYIMTITNHTPYKLPNGYAVPDLTIEHELKAHLLQSEKASIEAFACYRYACDYLGDFIRHVRENPSLRNKTIIAVSGDHTTKGVLKTSAEELLKKHGVPFILYVPQEYLIDKYIDTVQWASHKDIFPTLFNLALSGAQYYHQGKDLLNHNKDNNFAVDVSACVINSCGAINLINNQYYQWDSLGKLLPVNNSDKIDNLQYKVRLWQSISKYINLRSFK